MNFNKTTIELQASELDTFFLKKEKKTKHIIIYILQQWCPKHGSQDLSSKVDQQIDRHWQQITI